MWWQLRQEACSTAAALSRAASVCAAVSLAWPARTAGHKASRITRRRCATVHKVYPGAFRMQAELHRAQLMQRVAALPAPEQAATGNREWAAPPQQTAIQEQVRTNMQHVSTPYWFLFTLLWQSAFAAFPESREGGLLVISDLPDSVLHPTKRCPQAGLPFCTGLRRQSCAHRHPGCSGRLPAEHPHVRRPAGG